MIERARADHLKSVCELTYQYYLISPYRDHIAWDTDTALDQLRRHMIDPTSLFLVFSYAGQPRGYAIATLCTYLFNTKPFVNIDYIFVHPDYRSSDHSAAEQLVEHIEAWAIQCEAAEIVCGDIGINPEVISRWYRSQGYSYQGVCMTKRLNHG